MYMLSGRIATMLELYFRIGDQVVNVEPDILDNNSRLIKINTPGRVLSTRKERGIQMVTVIWFTDELPYHTIMEIPSTFIQMKSSLQFQER